MDPEHIRIGALARASVAGVADDDVSAANATMPRAGVRRLLVTDAAGRLAGIVSIDDRLRIPAVGTASWGLRA